MLQHAGLLRVGEVIQRHAVLRIHPFDHRLIHCLGEVPQHDGFPRVVMDLLHQRRVFTELAGHALQPVQLVTFGHLGAEQIV